MQYNGTADVEILENENARLFFSAKIEGEGQGDKTNQVRTEREKIRRRVAYQGTEKKH